VIEPLRDIRVKEKSESTLLWAPCDRLPDHIGMFLLRVGDGDYHRL
jgi:hypothetical protein